MIMKNKVLIRAIFPSINKEYDIKIPVNEAIWRVSKLVVKAIYDMNGMKYDTVNDSFIIINKTTGNIYDMNSVVIDSDIRNGTELLFLKHKKSEV